jgi:hypothetical protein
MMDKFAARVEKLGLISTKEGHTRVLPGAFSAVGGALGSRFGPQGKLIGSAIGSGVARITGQGDYTIRSNSLIDNGGKLSPQFINQNGDLRVCHKEFVHNITSTIDFFGRRLPVNPGIQQLFPSLSKISQNYTEYRFNGLVFEFRSTSGPIATTPASGVVVMATQYNPVESDFTNKIQMDSYMYANSCKPYEGMLHAVECEQRQAFSLSHLIRFGSHGIDQSLLPFYDLGSFSIATEGMAAAGDVVGELWVTYDVTLMKPKIQPVLYTPFGSYMHSSGNTVLNAIYPPVVDNQTDWLSITNGVAGSATMFFKQIGVYLVSFSVTGTGVTDFAATGTGDLTVELTSRYTVNAIATRTCGSFTVRVLSASSDANYVVVEVPFTTIVSAIWSASQELGPLQPSEYPHDFRA